MAKAAYRPISMTDNHGNFIVLLDFKLRNLILGLFFLTFTPAINFHQSFAHIASSLIPLVLSIMFFINTLSCVLFLPVGGTKLYLIRRLSLSFLRRKYALGEIGDIYVEQQDSAGRLVIKTHSGETLIPVESFSAKGHYAALQKLAGRLRLSCAKPGEQSTEQSSHNGQAAPARKTVKPPPTRQPKPLLTSRSSRDILNIKRKSGLVSRRDNNPVERGDNGPKVGSLIILSLTIAGIVILFGS